MMANLCGKFLQILNKFTFPFRFSIIHWELRIRVYVRTDLTNAHHRFFMTPDNIHKHILIFVRQICILVTFKDFFLSFSIVNLNTFSWLCHRRYMSRGSISHWPDYFCLSMRTFAIDINVILIFSVFADAEGQNHWFAHE